MHTLYLVLLLSCFSCLHGKKFGDKSKPDWAKKDITDYNEVDMERLLDQWDEDEDPLPEDELPEHLRPKPNIQFDPTNIQNPEELLKMSKKGQTLMMFVRVKESYSKLDAEEITKRWQTSLWNNHIQVERYMIDDHRAIFMFKDGAHAWETKDFLIEQSELQECTIENKPYYGKFTKEANDEINKQKGEL